jgi:2-oxo-3-hexenedioate decarboxylase
VNVATTTQTTQTAVAELAARLAKAVADRTAIEQLLAKKNGEVVATATGSAFMGHPAAAVAWLVRQLSAGGEGLRAGEIVLSGGLTAAVPVGPGDVVAASIDRLGSIELDCR